MSSLELTSERHRWASKADMIVSIICATLGMGDLWKFPFVCIENGGGAFIIPYLIVVTIVVQPLFYLELAMGTFSGTCNVKMFEKLGYLWKGIGITQCIINFISNSTYAYIMSIALYYITQSFGEILPWDVCVDAMGSECIPTGNITMYSSPENQKIASAYLYLHKIVKHQYQTIDETADWLLYVSCFVTWLIVGLLISDNIRSLSKLLYFMVVFPAIIIFLLLLRSSMREGSLAGIIFFFTPDWARVFGLKSWLAAINQCIFSFSLGIGTLSLYASFGPVHTNMRTISTLIILVDLCSCFLCSFSVFCSIGTLSYELGINIRDIEIEGGMHLAFVTYPTAISYFDKPSYLFLVIFFVMLFILGLGSLCAGCLVISCSIQECFPDTYSYLHLSIIISTFGFASGIAYCSNVGAVCFEIVEFYVSVVGVLVIIIMENVCFVYCNGIQSLCWDIEFIVKFGVNIFWRYMWYSSPIIILTFSIYTWIDYTRSISELWIKITAHVFMLIYCSPILYFLVAAIQKKIKLKKEYAILSKSNWHPHMEKDIQEYNRFIYKKKLMNKMG